jgi:hypothetical protein
MHRKIIPSLLLLFAYPAHFLAQVPTHIDPGQSDDAKRLSEEPEYIILLVALIVLLVLLFFWLRRRK